jgi:hypothetical protein
VGGPGNLDTAVPPRDQDTAGRVFRLVRLRVVLLQKYLNVYSYVALDIETGRVRALPLWGWWQRSIRRRRPTVHGLFTKDRGLFFALYAVNDRLYWQAEELALPIARDLRATVVREGRANRFALRDGDAVVYEHRYRRKRALIPEHLDPTPFRELVTDDFFELMAELISDREKRTRTAADWTRGFAF